MSVNLSVPASIPLVTLVTLSATANTVTEVLLPVNLDMNVTILPITTAAQWADQGHALVDGGVIGSVPTVPIPVSSGGTAGVEIPIHRSSGTTRIFLVSTTASQQVKVIIDRPIE